MADIRVIWDHETQMGDLVLNADGSLAGGADLETAVIISLATDRTADVEDELPDFSEDRRGWWGDYEAGALWGHDSQLGSRLWLLRRSKLNAETETLAEIYANEALQWLVDVGAASKLEVIATRRGTSILALQTKVWRGPELDVDLRYQLLWSEL